MKKMTALKEFKYDGVLLSVGDEFKCQEKDVKLLTAIKKVEPAKPKSKAAEPEISNKQLEADSDAQSDEQLANSQGYKTRAMKSK